MSRGGNRWDLGFILEGAPGHALGVALDLLPGYSTPHGGPHNRPSPKPLEFITP